MSNPQNYKEHYKNNKFIVDKISPLLERLPSTEVDKVIDRLETKIVLVPPPKETPPPLPYKLTTTRKVENKILDLILKYSDKI